MLATLAIGLRLDLQQIDQKIFVAVRQGIAELLACMGKGPS